MARPPIFPLSDSHASAILRGVDMIGFVHAEGASTRPFLREFINLVHAVTGKRFGASTYRKMLSLYVPSCAPSTETIQNEIRNFHLERSNSSLLTDGLGLTMSAPKAATVTSPKTIRSSPARDHAIDSTLELARQHSLENTRLRQKIDRLNDHLAETRGHQMALQESVVRHLATAEAQAETIHGLQDQLRELTATITIIQQRSDATMRHALMQVENVRKETREAEAQRDAALRRTEALQIQLKNAQVMADSFRRQLSKTREASPAFETNNRKSVEQ